VHAQVPHAPRDFWKQRSRWAKAAHLYILDSKSVFWRRQQHMTLYQKSLYCIPLMLHFWIVLTEPVMFTLPFICVVWNLCPYGIDVWLWASHFLKLSITFILSTHADTWAKRVAALNAQTSSRILFFVNVKAVFNTIMVGLRWKLPGAFKETKKTVVVPRPLGEAQQPRSRAPLPAQGWPTVTSAQRIETPSRTGRCVLEHKSSKKGRPVGEAADSDGIDVHLVETLIETPAGTPKEAPSDGSGFHLMETVIVPADISGAGHALSVVGNSAIPYKLSQLGSQQACSGLQQLTSASAALGRCRLPLHIYSCQSPLSAYADVQ
jgi:hypothetical protein